MVTSAIDALRQLREGNRRYASDDQKSAMHATQTRRDELLGGQNPFAVILGCSDSRVPPEIIFDQGLGTLFVVRVAGNIVATSQLGSIEFAAQQLGVRLIVVLGHSSCGAVTATVNELQNPTSQLSPSLSSIVDHIRPAVEPLLKSEHANDPQHLLQQAVRANVRASVEQLKSKSQVLSNLVQNDGLHVVCAEYSLETGIVDWFDDLP